MGEGMIPGKKPRMWECPRHRFRMRVEYYRLAKNERECVALEETIFNSFSSPRSYREKTRCILYNLRASPTLLTTRPLVDVLLMSEEEMACGTIVEVVSTNEKRREEMLTHLMKEKMADIDEMGGEGPLRCKTCGSSAVVWDQKQTRSADEVCGGAPCYRVHPPLTPMVSAGRDPCPRCTHRVPLTVPRRAPPACPLRARVCTDAYVRRRVLPARRPCALRHPRCSATARSATRAGG